jgi:signal transduction histidine kinase
LEDEIHDHAYAIGREVLCNAARYSHARCLSLKISYSRMGLKMDIHDDGCGLTYEECGNELNGGWGIRGIQERARNMGATLQISSNSNEGTTVSLFVKAKTAFVDQGKFYAPYCSRFFFRNAVKTLRR